MSDQHFENSSYSPFEIHICCGKPHKTACQTACQTAPAQARHSDLRTDYKQFGLKAITNQIENQPANHARSTNVHRATHAENYAHCVNCDTNCFDTSNANLLRDSFDLLAQQRIRWHSNQLHHIVSSPIIDVSDFSCVLLHYEASSLHSTIRRFASSPNSFVSGIMLSLDTRPSFDLTPLPLAFSVHRPNRLGSFSTISAAAATDETAVTAVTAESFPKILVCLLIVGQSVRMFAIMHHSRCFPLIVVVVMIAATIFDQHVVTTREFCVPAMAS